MRKEYTRNSNKQNYLFFAGKTTEKRLIYGLLGARGVDHTKNMLS